MKEGVAPRKPAGGSLPEGGEMGIEEDMAFVFVFVFVCW